MKSSEDARIGVLVDMCEGALSPLIDEAMIRHIAGLPQVICCVQDENLASSDRLERVLGRVARRPADRWVVVGGSPSLYERAFRRLRATVGLHPPMSLVANVREQVAWVTPDPTRAREKAKRVIEKTIREAALLSPIGEDRVELSKSAVVIGGGIIGIIAARALAEANVHVTLLTSAEDIGEKAVEFSHFGEGPRDAEGWFKAQVEWVKQCSSIEVKASMEVKAVEGYLGNYRISIQDDLGRTEIVTGSAIILATGYDVLPNGGGIFDHPRFVSPAQMRMMLEGGKRSLTNDRERPIRTVAFVLDLTNEAILIDGTTAINAGIRLREMHDCAVYVLCRDIKVALDGMEQRYRGAREMGVTFIKYDDPPRFSLVDGQIKVEVKEVSTRMRGDEYSLSVLSDVVVLSEAFVPSRENETLSRVLGLPLGNDGYLMEDNPRFQGVGSNRRGIFLAGGCRYPRVLTEALVEAGAAAAGVIGLLSQGLCSFDLTVAEVDPAKCAACLTCMRVCPHGAIIMEPYAESNVYVTPWRKNKGFWTAARVLPVQCYGCGICVAACPTRAITLKHQTDAQISVQIEGHA